MLPEYTIYRGQNDHGKLNCGEPAILRHVCRRWAWNCSVWAGRVCNFHPGPLIVTPLGTTNRRRSSFLTSCHPRFRRQIITVPAVLSAKAKATRALVRNGIKCQRRFLNELAPRSKAHKNSATTIKDFFGLFAFKAAAEILISDCQCPQRAWNSCASLPETKFVCHLEVETESERDCCFLRETLARKGKKNPIVTAGGNLAFKMAECTRSPFLLWSCPPPNWMWQLFAPLQLEAKFYLRRFVSTLVLFTIAPIALSFSNACYQRRQNRWDGSNHVPLRAEHEVNTGCDFSHCLDFWLKPQKLISQLPCPRRKFFNDLWNVTTIYSLCMQTELCVPCFVQKFISQYFFSSFLI